MFCKTVDIKQRKHCVFIFHHISHSPIEKQDSGRCRTVFVLDVERQHQMTAEVTIYLILCLAPSHLSFLLTLSPPLPLGVSASSSQLTQVELS